MNENREMDDCLSADRSSLCVLFRCCGTKKMILTNLYRRYESISVHYDNPMMRGFGESDESTDSDPDEGVSTATHSRAEPLNWYIANNEWSTGHVSREVNQSTASHRHKSQRGSKI